MSTEFKVGDIVEWGGVRGEVTETNTDTKDTAYLKVYFREVRETEYFTLDGRFYPWHTKPSLILIERPKKKVKKTIEGWVNVYPSTWGDFCPTEKDANSVSSASERIACVKVTGEYEVEE